MFKKAKYVLTIYKEGSFTKAAEALYISQPCLSAAIKQIESDLGARLFDRSTASVRPTLIGMEYIRTAQEILALEESFALRINEYNSLLTGKLRIGGSNYVCSYIIPYMINIFSQLYSNVAIELVEEHSSALSEMLADGKIDIIVDSYDSAPEGCIYTPLLSEKILLAVPKSFRSNDPIKDLAAKTSELYDGTQSAKNLDEISIEHFKDENFILLKNENSMYRHAMQIFKDSGVMPHVKLFLDQLSTSYFLCTQGGGCAFVTDTVFKYHSFNDPIYLYNIKGSKERTLGIAYKQDKYVSPVVERFVKTAKENVPSNKNK